MLFTTSDVNKRLQVQLSMAFVFDYMSQREYILDARADICIIIFYHLTVKPRIVATRTSY